MLYYIHKNRELERGDAVMKTRNIFRMHQQQEMNSSALYAKIAQSIKK